MRAIAVAAVIGLGLLWLGARPASSQAFPVDVTLKLDRVAYEAGTAIPFTVVIRNPGSAAVVLTFPTSQRFDLVLHNGPVEVSRWSQGQLFTQELTELRLGPGEALTYVGQWLPLTTLLPRGVQESPVEAAPTGLYTIYAEVPVVGARPVSERMPIIIGQPISLVRGCVTLQATYPQPLPVDFIAQTIDPPGVLSSIWVTDPLTGIRHGYSPVPGAANDLGSVGPSQTLTVCLTTPGQILMP